MLSNITIVNMKSCIVFYICDCGVKIWQFYKSDFLVNIYLGSIMKRTNNYRFLQLLPISIINFMVL